MEKRKAAYYLIFFVSICLVSCVSSPPEWYLKPGTDSGFIIGTGEGTTKQQAKDRALEDIASQVEIKISAQTSIIEKESDSESSILYEHDVETVVDIVLSGAERVKEEKRGNTYYCVYRYDNRPLRLRVSKTSMAEAYTLSGMSNKNFYRNLPFSLFLRKNGMEEDFILYHKNSVWNVSIGGHVLPVSGRELTENFFLDGGEGEILLVHGPLNGSMMIGQASDTLKAGQNFSLRVIPPKSGFMSLYYVDNAGVTLELLESHPVERGVEYIYPDPTVRPGGMVAQSAERFTYSTDMIIAVFSSEPLVKIADLQKISEESVSAANDGLYAYGSLLEILNDGNNSYTWCSKIIHVEE